MSIQGPEIFIRLKKGSINDFYDFQTQIGEGAYGSVYKAIHKTTGIVRALKKLKKDCLVKEDEQLFFAELHILQNLDHPNIVKLHELYQDEIYYYLITEYCNGGELFEKIKKLQSFSEKIAAQYLKQILSAISYCHEKNIVHRDIKPENILFDSDQPDAALKIIDFGTARRFETGKKMTKLLGTAYYMAPEVILQKYNQKCDIWSIGIILYTMLCGYPPFRGASQKEILKKVQQGKVEFDPEDWDEISQSAKTLIKKMLTYNSYKRISAKDALNDT